MIGYMQDRQQHWDGVYSRLGETEVSWYEAEPAESLRLLRSAGVTAADSVIDAGAGSSRLVESLLAQGFTDLTALDVSAKALAKTRQRMNAVAAERIQWITADLLTWRPQRRWAVWHDRAVFHFLTDPDDQRRYRELLTGALSPRGVAVIGCFAEDGPTQCSGLPTARHSREEIAEQFGPEFKIIEQSRSEHRTPSGGSQSFNWSVLRRRDQSLSAAS
jgi:SAM-dependent methyltransferase